MSEAKHTPGPWKLRRAETALEHDFILRAGPHTIAWSVPRADRSDTRKKSVHIANARLIAAAPELLEALLVARKHITEDRASYVWGAELPDGSMDTKDAAILHEAYDSKLAQIEAAIAKATG